MGKSELEGQCSEAVQSMSPLTLLFLYFFWKASVRFLPPFSGATPGLCFAKRWQKIHLSPHGETD